MKPSCSVHCNRCHTPSAPLVVTQMSADSSLGSGDLLGQLLYSTGEPSTHTIELSKNGGFDLLKMNRKSRGKHLWTKGQWWDSYCLGWKTSPATRIGEEAPESRAAPEQNDSLYRSRLSGRLSCLLQSRKTLAKSLSLQQHGRFMEIWAKLAAYLSACNALSTFQTWAGKLQGRNCNNFVQIWPTWRDTPLHWRWSVYCLWDRAEVRHIIIH